MSRFGTALLLVATGAAGIAGGYWYARQPALSVSAVGPVVATAAVERKVLYYRDPSGAPYWSADPKKDGTGRDYLPVHEDEEPSSGAADRKPQEVSTGPRKIRFYRNPMGLPDTSPYRRRKKLNLISIKKYLILIKIKKNSY